MIALIANAEASDGRSTRVGISASRDGWAIALKTPSRKCQREQQPDRDRAGVDEDREQHRLGAAGDLRHADDADAVAPVGERTGERAQKHDRKKLGHRHHAEPGSRMGQGPGEPADRYALHPDADQRHGVAARINAVVAMGKGERGVADAARKQTTEIEGQEFRRSKTAKRAAPIVTRCPIPRQPRAVVWKADAEGLRGMSLDLRSRPGARAELVTLLGVDLAAVRARGSRRRLGEPGRADAIAERGADDAAALGRGRRRDLCALHEPRRDRIRTRRRASPQPGSSAAGRIRPIIAPPWR